MGDPPVGRTGGLKRRASIVIIGTWLALTAVIFVRNYSQNGSVIDVVFGAIVGMSAVGLIGMAIFAPIDWLI
jgi:hypothetical protein